MNVDTVAESFLTFWRRNGEALLKGMLYQDAAFHLAFMAFMQRVVTKTGRIDYLLETGSERAALVVELNGKYNIFLVKLRRGSHTTPEGVEVVAAYARQFGCSAGCLLVYDRENPQPWDERGALDHGQRDGVSIVLACL